LGTDDKTGANPVSTRRDQKRSTAFVMTRALPGSS
jgi:hypothetical protein